MKSKRSRQQWEVNCDKVGGSFCRFLASNETSVWLVGLFFCFCFQLWQSSFHWIISRIVRKWKQSNSSDGNSVEPTDLWLHLGPPIFYLHWVVSVMTPTLTMSLTPTLSLEKTIPISIPSPSPWRFFGLYHPTSTPLESPIWLHTFLLNLFSFANPLPP